MLHRLGRDAWTVGARSQSVTTEDRTKTGKQEHPGTGSAPDRKATVQYGSLCPGNRETSRDVRMQGDACAADACSHSIGLDTRDSYCIPLPYDLLAHRCYCLYRLSFTEVKKKCTRESFEYLLHAVTTQEVTTRGCRCGDTRPRLLSLLFAPTYGGYAYTALPTKTPVLRYLMNRVHRRLALQMKSDNRQALTVYKARVSNAAVRGATSGNTR